MKLTLQDSVILFLFFTFSGNGGWGDQVTLQRKYNCRSLEVHYVNAKSYNIVIKKGKYIGQPSLRSQPKLCKQCNRNQMLKIQELNYFDPPKESNFDAELKKHKVTLDEKYQLCFSCQEVVSDHLKHQAMDLKTFLLCSRLNQTKSTPTKVHPVSAVPVSLFLLLLQLLCVVLALLLLCSCSLPESHLCDGLQSFSWGMSGHAVWITSMEVANLTNYLFQQLTHPTSVLSSVWENGLAPVLCLCSQMKRRYLHVALLCLLLQLLLFMKRKTRFGLVVLFCWTSLCFLRVWELVWMQKDMRWRVVVTVSCCASSGISLLFTFVLYCGVINKKKKKRFYFTPSPKSKVETQSSRASETDTSVDQATVDLDCNLNAMSLGLPTSSRRSHVIHTSTGNHRTGPFWRRKEIGNSAEIPLVSMHQRPLIVPATLQFSGLQERSRSSCLREQNQETASFSSGDELSSGSMDVDTPVKITSVVSPFTASKRRVQNPSWKNKRKGKPFASKLRILFSGIIPMGLFLLLASLLLNLYFIVVLTEWPVRILRSVLNIFNSNWNN